MSDALTIAMLGAGAWGSALATQATRAGHRVRLWARDPTRAAAPATPDLGAVLAGAALAVVAVPTPALRALLQALPAGGPPMLLCAKGVEARHLRLPLEIAAETCPGRSAGVLSGPTFAHEVAAGLPAAAVVASLDPALRAVALRALATPAFRLYGSDDPVGVQLGGAAKNVLAIAAGAVVGAGLGENARAALVTRGLAELARLVVALGGRAETAAGLSGLGDLLLSAAGPSSRNFAFGLDLGRGRAPAANRTGTVEGIATAPALMGRAAAAGIDLPICAAVAALLAGEVTLAAAVDRLLARPPRHE